MKKMLGVILGLLAVSAFAVVAGPPEVKTYPTKMGTVTFPHAGHAKAGVKCVECHHMNKADADSKACSSCHDAKAANGKTPKLVDAVHSSCWECHKTLKAAGKKAGPEKKDCKLCHVKA